MPTQPWIALLAVVPILSAQDITFRTGAQLVEVQAVVTGWDRKPVTNLTKDDFTILDEGKPKDIAFFAPPSVQQALKRPATLPPGVVSNRPEYAPTAPQSVTCILIDDLNSPVPQRLYFHGQVLDFLRAYRGTDPIAIYVIRGRLAIVHDFTSDLAPFMARLGRAGSAGTKAGVQAQAKEFERMINEVAGPNIDVATTNVEQIAEKRGRFTLRSVEAIARRISGIQGRKNLVWIGYGFRPLTRPEENLPGYKHSGGYLSTQALRDQTLRVLCNSGVAVYPIDGQGLAVTGGYLKGLSLGPGMEGTDRAGMTNVTFWSSDFFASMWTFAQRTGGTLARENNDMTAGMRTAVEDVHSSYTLAFYTDRTDQRPMSIQVKVRGSDVTVRHRKLYYPESTMYAEKHDRDTIRQILSSPVAPTTVRLDARVVRAAGQYRVSVTVDPSALSLKRDADVTTGSINVWFALESPGGQITTHSGRFPLRFYQQKLAKIWAAGVTFEQTFPVEPKAISMRILVQDDSNGATGAVDINVNTIPNVESH